MDAEETPPSLWLLPTLVALGVGVVLAVLQQLPPRVEEEPPPEVAAAVEEVGSSTCAGCHPEQHEAWATSTHARAERPLGADEPLVDGALTLVGPDGAEASFTPVRAIGVEPLVQYLVPLDAGRLQSTQLAWDPQAEVWFDVFGDDRGPGEWGHWTGGAMTWNSQCAFCHNTGVDKGFDEASWRYDTTVEEHGVGCEACHGDSDAHAAGGPPPEVPSDRVSDTCAGCHARRAELTGAFEPGDRFEDHFAPTFADLADTYWPDGQVRDEDFEWSAFRSSRMYEVGLRCTSCHDPHTGAPIAEGDALCTSCHAALPGFEAHDPHPEGAAVGCVGCHMPITTYMERDPRHDHGFRIPDPVLTVRHGIPNACSRCHVEAPVEDLVAAAEAWYPQLGGPRRVRADSLARGRAGDDTAIPELVAILETDTLGSFRASAAAMLGAHLDRPQVREALVKAASDPDPWTRFSAIGALSPAAVLPEVSQVLEAALDDETRAVRVEAGRALRTSLAASSPRLEDYLGYLRHNADQPATLLERGAWALEQGHLRSALDDLEQAAALDAHSPAILEALAVAWSTAGEPERAVQALESAVEARPDDAELQYRLGLARGAVGDVDGAVAALRAAVELDTAHGRAWYNLGVLLGQVEDWPGALEALGHAVSLQPRVADVRYALASTQHRAGQVEAAAATAREVLELDPRHAGAQSMLRGR